MASYKVISNTERHFSIDALIRKATEREARKVVPTGSLLNWSVVHHMSKYYRPMHWIRQGEDYYIAVDRLQEQADRIREEREHGQSS